MTDNINRITPRELKDKILQLIYLAEVNLECCNVINSFFKRQKENSSRIHYNIFLNQNETKYWVLSANNHFCDSISIIHSLLHRTNNNKELSFQLYEKKVLYERDFKDKSKTREFLSWTKNLWKELNQAKDGDGILRINTGISFILKLIKNIQMSIYTMRICF